MSNPTDIPTAMTLYGALVRDDNNPPQAIGWLKSYITLAAPTTTVQAPPEVIPSQQVSPYQDPNTVSPSPSPVLPSLKFGFA